MTDGASPSLRRLADRAAIGVLAGTGAVFLLLMVFRLARGGRSGPGLLSPLTLVLAAGILIICIALWRGGLLRSVVAVGVVTGAVTVYAAEMALEIASLNANARAARRLGVRYDSRTRWQLVDSLRAAGADAWPVMVPALAWGRLKVLGHDVPWPDSTRPLAGLPGVVTVYCREASAYTIYRSDVLGFNNTGAPDSAGTGGIAVLGDSFIHGACVPADSGLVAQFRTWHADARSFGQDGSGPLMELATLREIVAPLRPRLVVWTWFEGNDFANLSAERADPRLMAYLDTGHRTGLGLADVAVMRRWMDSLLVIARTARQPGVMARAGAVVMLTRMRQAWRDRRPAAPPSDEDLALLGRVLSAARADAEQWGGRVVLAYLPGWHRYFAPGRQPVRRDDVLKAAREAGITVLDLVPAFDSEVDKAGLFGYGAWQRGHYSGRGYQLAALGLSRGIAGVP